MRAFFLIAIAACGSPSSSSSSPPPATKPDVAKPYTLTDRGVTVTTTFAPPAGWSEDKRDDALHWQGTWMAKLSLAITCHGSCDTVETATKNIARQAKEQFDFVSSANHIPPLVATWKKPVAEVAPGVWSWRFDAVNAKEHQAEHTFSVDRLLPGDPKTTLVLTCNGEIDEREDPAIVDVLEKRCLDLVYAAAPAAKK